MSKKRHTARKFYEKLPPTDKLGDGPAEQEYINEMTAVMRGIDRLFNGDLKGEARKVGIVMLVFPFGAVKGRCNFMSNGANRQDVVVLFKEMIARFEGQPEQEGHA